MEWGKRRAGSGEQRTKKKREQDKCGELESGTRPTKKIGVGVGAGKKGTKEKGEKGKGGQLESKRGTRPSKKGKE